jgi:hypothetical protein
MHVIVPKLLMPNVNSLAHFCHQSELFYEPEKKSNKLFQNLTDLSNPFENKYLIQLFFWLRPTDVGNVVYLQKRKKNLFSDSFRAPEGTGVSLIIDWDIEGGLGEEF